MTHEILSIKLCELDEQFSRLSSRIHLTETAARSQLQQEMRDLRRECDEAGLTLETRLKRSRTGMAAVLAGSFGEVERCVREAAAALRRQSQGGGDPHAAAEEKIFLAEYALDFALQAANHALLISMEAIKAQMAEQEQEDSEEKEATE